MTNRRQRSHHRVSLRSFWHLRSRINLARRNTAGAWVARRITWSQVWRCWSRPGIYFAVVQGAFVIFSGVLLVTLAWAVYESGSGFWTVGSRIWIIGLMALWLVSANDPSRLMATTDASVIQFAQRATVCSSESAGAGRDVHQPIRQRQCRLRTYFIRSCTKRSDWHAYGGNKAGTRHAPLRPSMPTMLISCNAPGKYAPAYLDVSLVHHCKLATALYLCTAQNVMISLDPDSGERTLAV